VGCILPAWGCRLANTPRWCVCGETSIVAYIPCREVGSSLSEGPFGGLPGNPT